MCITWSFQCYIGCVRGVCGGGGGGHQPVKNSEEHSAALESGELSGQADSASCGSGQLTH